MDMPMRQGHKWDGRQFVSVNVHIVHVNVKEVARDSVCLVTTQVSLYGGVRSSLRPRSEPGSIHQVR